MTIKLAPGRFNARRVEGRRRAALAFAIPLMLGLDGASGLWAQRGAPPAPVVRDPGGQPTRQLEAPGTAVVAGSIVVAGTGQPARRARVNLSGMDGGGSRSTTTDDQGQFSVARLPAGRYSLSASKPGHINVSYGQVKPGRPGTPIQLADGQRFDVRLQMYKGGVITGTILDEAGEAVPGTQVRVMRYAMVNGARTLQSAGNGTTDDRGVYRVYGLQPGDHIVGATPRNTSEPTDFERMQTELRSVEAQLARAQVEEALVRDLQTRAAAIRSQMPEQSDQAPTGYAPVYYPGTTTSAEAGTLALGAGEEKTGVDFQLQRVLIARIEGTVVNSSGQPLQNMQVMLVSRSGVPGVETSSARPDAEGRFRLQNVAPGHYTVSVRATSNQAQAESAARPLLQPQPAPAGRGAAPRPESMRYWASADVVVDGRNVSNLILTLQPGMSLTGRVQFEGSLPAPTDLSRVRVSLSPIATPGEPAQAVAGRVDASGKFTITGVVPGKYRLTGSGGGQGWFLESATIDSQDTLDFPIEIKPNQAIGGAVLTFSDRQAEISGAVLNDRGQPAPEYMIVLYPTDQRFWTPNSRRIRTTRPATDGRYSFGTILSGEYRLAPIFDAEPGSWFDPGFLQQLDAVGVRVTAHDGEKKVQNLQVK
jgi:protocatechuate 3,4-dioxygenase beta subunit